MVAEEKQVTKPAYVLPEEYLVRERAAFGKVEVWRKNENGRWVLAESHVAAAASVRIDTIDLVISLEKMYAQTVGLLV